jgi:hypothetical protein
MKDFAVDVTVDMPFPRTFSYREKANAMHTAVARAMVAFRKDVGRKQIKEVKIKVNKL